MYEMSYKREINFWGGKEREGNDRLAISKYPSTAHGDVYDHTYGYVQIQDPKKMTYFDAAGGHPDPALQKTSLSQTAP